ncbi:MAG: aspartate-semialdehyde dehydrogenase [Anaerolineaceae bacterium]|nr:aspartate-semialdehyde dehydrogenase [Anaerolineaceae bacterium]
MQKIPIAILGATGVVGQRFIQLLADHPWFEITALVGSDRSAGKPYLEAAPWRLLDEPPAFLREMTVQPLEGDLPARLLFSALPSEIAKEWEPRFAQAGFAVCSNASAYRNELDIPLIIPEINAEYVNLIPHQRERLGWKGFIVTSPNCTTTTAVMPLKPLHDAFGVKKVLMTSLQAMSGSGYPGVPAMDIYDNVIPYISGEEEKMELETRILLSAFDPAAQRPAEQIAVSAQANRVPVIDGHTVCVSVEFERKPTVEEALNVLRSYRGAEIVRQLPSAPQSPIIVREEADRPQPRRDRDADHGMAASVGRVRPCPILDLKFVSVIHNAVRGAAGGAVLNAELLAAKGYLK